jgi:hypothetical protein
MERAKSNSSSGGGGEVGVVTLLELPVEKTTLIVDGEPRRLVHANFAGLCQIPSQNQFHLLVVRVISDENNGSVSHATGLVILWSTPGRISRHYNAYTEELNEKETPQQLDTSTNHQHHPPTPPLLVPYDKFVSQSAQELWRGQTRYIQRSLLAKRGLTGQGDKVVPGAYDDDEDKEEGTKQSSNGDMADGKSVQYPVGIPCLEDASSSSSSSSNPRSLLHEGTKQYLRTLTPTQRTALLCSPKPAADAAFWNVFQTIYQNSWQDVLGDVQLSFVLFLHLGCLSSFQHWYVLSCTTLYILYCVILHFTFPKKDNLWKRQHLHVSPFWFRRNFFSCCILICAVQNIFYSFIGEIWCPCFHLSVMKSCPSKP